MTEGSDPRYGAGAKAALLPQSGRYALAAFGCVCVATGIVGIVVPGLPTTPFLLLAAWAFSKSSRRFHDWLVGHPRLGPPVVAWRERGAIPLRAKLLAVTVMTASFAWIVLAVAENWVMPTVIGIVMAGAAIYVVTRPNA